MSSDKPTSVWMHQSLGYWFSVADECKEEGDIPYVPASRVDEVWDRCRLLLHETRISKHSSTRDKIVIQDDRKSLLQALEAARRESEEMKS